MDERKLRYFLAVIDEGGVTRAARKLHVAQPSLSQALRALESELKAELFYRLGRSLRPTAAGIALTAAARQVVRDMDTVRAVVSDVVNLDSGTLDIAALATLAVDPLAALIGNFRRLHPGVTVNVVEPNSGGAVSTLVSEGGSEIGLAHLPLTHQSMITHELGKQELLFVLPPHSDVERDAPLAASALKQIPLVLSPPGTSTRILLETALADSGVSPLIAVQTSAREAIVPLVLAGAGAALLPAPIAEEARRRGAIVRAADPPITRHIGLIHRDGPLSPAARVFTELAIDSESTVSKTV